MTSATMIGTKKEVQKLETNLISSVLGSFVVRLESKDDFSLQDFSLIDDSDFEALQWYSCM